jgi:hypothetical protein
MIVHYNGQWQHILLERKQLVTGNENLVTSLEGSSDNTLLGLHGEVHLVDGAENLVDLADGSLLRKR